MVEIAVMLSTHGISPNMQSQPSESSVVDWDTEPVLYEKCDEGLGMGNSKI